MTHTALVRRRIAFLRQATGVTIVVRLGDPDVQQPKQKAPLNLMTLAETLWRFKNLMTLAETLWRSRFVRCTQQAAHEQSPLRKAQAGIQRHSLGVMHGNHIPKVCTTPVLSSVKNAQGGARLFHLCGGGGRTPSGAICRPALGPWCAPPQRQTSSAVAHRARLVGGSAASLPLQK